MPRRKTLSYFSTEKDAPPPLKAEAPRRVRFEEVDALGIVWHGRYPGFFEDARVAFGDRYGLRYLDMFENEFIAPIVQLHLDYHHPLHLDEPFVITAAMHWCESARLNMQYEITGPENRLIATGYSAQILMNLEREVLVVWPEYLEKFRNRWKSGGFSGC